ncbi:MAG: helix-turn-helix domain-containing protein, partial [Thermoguttaceae bacterium]
ETELATRIRIKYLEALEQSDYSNMTPVQAQGFLRNYAHFLDPKADSPVFAAQKLVQSPFFLFFLDFQHDRATRRKTDQSGGNFGSGTTRETAQNSRFGG